MATQTTDTQQQNENEQKPQVFNLDVLLDEHYIGEVEYKGRLYSYANPNTWSLYQRHQFNLKWRHYNEITTSETPIDEATAAQAEDELRELVRMAVPKLPKSVIDAAPTTILQDLVLNFLVRTGNVTRMEIEQIVTGASARDAMILRAAARSTLAPLFPNSSGSTGAQTRSTG